jgi:phosphoribosylanthranilate isomerase
MREGPLEAGSDARAMRVRVKMCGITSAADAALCVEAGADALGFIFVENTPRCMTSSQVRTIVAALPPFVVPVGVFWDHPREDVLAVARECGLGAVQLHGEEDLDAFRNFPLPVIKTIKVRSAADLDRVAPYRTAAFLLDSPERWSEGEPRMPIPWGLLSAQAGRARVILSGGLTADNVAEAIRVVRPFAVDVNSGVEARPGRKDPDRVRRFMQAVGAALEQVA